MGKGIEFWVPDETGEGYCWFPVDGYFCRMVASQVREGHRPIAYGLLAMELMLAGF